MSSLFRFRRLAAGFAVALVAGLLALLPATPRAEEAFDDAQKKAIGEIIRDYLMANPEVLRDALIGVSEFQHAEEMAERAKAVADNRDKLINSEFQVVLGNPDGDVTLVEFFDYNCGACKTALSGIMDLLKSDPNLRVVLKELPILGRASIEAAQVAVAVNAQGKYLDFHQMLMSSSSRTGREQALEAAEKLGLDMDKIKADMESPLVADTISETYALSQALAINGTPAFVLGNEVIDGAIGYAALKEKIDAVRKCGETSC